MPVYTVHAPVTTDAGIRAADRFAFVRDGFHFWAAVAGVIWLAWHRLWLALLGWIVVLLAVDFGMAALGARSGAILFANLLLALLMGFEAASLRRWTLSRRNWRQLDIVVADDEESAERRFFDRWTAKRARRRSTRGRSRRAAADAGYSGPAVFAAAAVAAQRDHRIVSGTRRLAVSVAIIDYGSGNLHSAAKAFERAARGMENPDKIVVTRDPEVVFRADRIVLPGVGAFADCRRGLDAVDGMLEAMTEAVRDKARPFFGICVGMQLMATRGKEHVTTDGFGWIAGDVEKISPREENLKIPHMGWNTLDVVREHPVLERLPLGPKGRHAYFVHSYHLNASNEADVLARADYGGPVTAMVGKDTAIGTQFHPEKSQRFGLALISNFLKWKP
jgi:glutamine amidotransferase